MPLPVPIRRSRRPAKSRRPRQGHATDTRLPTRLSCLDLVLPTVAQVQFKGLNCLTLASGKMYLYVGNVNLQPLLTIFQ